MLGMNLALTFHLAGAAIVGVLAVVAVVARLLRINWYRSLATGIGVGTAYQLITGAVLGYVMHGTVGAVCVRLIAYVAILTLVELMLFAAMRSEATQKFPLKTVALSFATGLASVAVFVLVSVVR